MKNEECHIIDNVIVNKYAKYQSSTINSYKMTVQQRQLTMVTETWLTNNITNNEILPKGYHVIRKDRNADKRGGGVLIALRERIAFNKITSRSKSLNWSDRLELNLN